MQKITKIEKLTEELVILDWIDRITESLKLDNDIDEGLLSTLLGGATGFLVGPIIGKAIAKVLGVEKGMLYDLLTSKVVTTALGVAIANSNVSTPEPVKKIEIKK